MNNERSSVAKAFAWITGIVGLTCLVILLTAKQSPKQPAPQAAPQPVLETTVSAAQITVANSTIDIDPKAAERAAMLASLGFGTNGGHDVNVNFTVSK